MIIYWVSQVPQSTCYWKLVVGEPDYYWVYLCILGCESNENIPAYIRACCALDLMSKTAVSCFSSDDDEDNDNDGNSDGDDDVNNSYF